MQIQSDHTFYKSASLILKIYQYGLFIFPILEKVTLKLKINVPHFMQ